MGDHPQRGSDDAATGAPMLVTPTSLRQRLAEFAVGLSWALYIPFVILPLDSLIPVRLFMLTIAGLSSFHFIRRASDSSPRLLVDSAGITDRTSIFGRELRIPWELVHAVTVPPDGYCDLEIRDLRALRKHASPGRRFEISVRRLLGKTKMRIGTILVGVDRHHLGRRIEKAYFQFERSQLGLSLSHTTNPDEATQAQS